MEEIEIHSFDQRLGKFEGIQQQHDQRLADIESRLGNIEVMLTDIRAEGHREREALRSELVGLINANRSELVGLITEERRERESLRTELNQRIDQLSNKIDGLYKWIIGILIAVGTSVIAAILKGLF